MRVPWLSRPEFPQAGAELASHQLIEVVGVGASAVVYRARHRSTGAESALKVWRIPLPDAARGQFLRECRIHWALSGHPNITRLFSASSPDAPLLWSSQELLRESLAERLRRPAQWDTSRALAMAVQLARAVEAIHLAGVLHRDINPGNIMVQGDRLAVADFGTADYAQHPRQDAAAGTPGFTAPELFEGARPSPLSDLFSTATTVGEMLGSKPPEVVVPMLRLARAPDPGHRRITVTELRRALEVALCHSICREQRWL